LTLEKIAVVGAGVMGRGIAHAGALGGFDVKLHDVDKEALKNATSSIEREIREVRWAVRAGDGPRDEHLDHEPDGDRRSYETT
jgi:3-hydroxyacyl-CoA dehydrogenase